MKSSFRKANRARSSRHLRLFTIAIIYVVGMSWQHLVTAFSTRSSLVVKPRRGKREGPITTTTTTTALALLENQNPYSEFSGLAGESALQQVQFLASKVAESTAAAERGEKKTVSKDDSRFVRGTGGTIFNNNKYNTGKRVGFKATNSDTLQVSSDSTNSDQVWTALANLELDSTYMSNRNSPPTCIVILFQRWKLILFTVRSVSIPSFFLVWYCYSANVGYIGGPKTSIDSVRIYNVKHDSYSCRIRSMDWRWSTDRILGSCRMRL